MLPGEYPASILGETPEKRSTIDSLATKRRLLEESDEDLSPSKLKKFKPNSGDDEQEEKTASISDNDAHSGENYQASHDVNPKKKPRLGLIQESCSESVVLKPLELELFFRYFREGKLNYDSVQDWVKDRRTEGEYQEADDLAELEREDTPPIPFSPPLPLSPPLLSESESLTSKFIDNSQALELPSPDARVDSPISSEHVKLEATLEKIHPPPGSEPFLPTIEAIKYTLPSAAEEPPAKKKVTFAPLPEQKEEKSFFLPPQSTPVSKQVVPESTTPADTPFKFTFSTTPASTPLQLFGESKKRKDEGLEALALPPPPASEPQPLVSEPATAKPFSFGQFAAFKSVTKPIEDSTLIKPSAVPDSMEAAPFKIPSVAPNLIQQPKPSIPAEAPPAPPIKKSVAFTIDFNKSPAPADDKKPSSFSNLSAPEKPTTVLFPSSSSSSSAFNFLPPSSIAAPEPTSTVAELESKAKAPSALFGTSFSFQQSTAPAPASTVSESEKPSAPFGTPFSFQKSTAPTSTTPAAAPIFGATSAFGKFSQPGAAPAPKPLAIPTSEATISKKPDSVFGKAIEAPSTQQSGTIFGAKPTEKSIFEPTLFTAKPNEIPDTTPPAPPIFGSSKPAFTVAPSGASGSSSNANPSSNIFGSSTTFGAPATSKPGFTATPFTTSVGATATPSSSNLFGSSGFGAPTTKPQEGASSTLFVQPSGTKPLFGAPPVAAGNETASLQSNLFGKQTNNSNTSSIFGNSTPSFGTPAGFGSAANPVNTSTPKFAQGGSGGVSTPASGTGGSTFGGFLSSKTPTGVASLGGNNAQSTATQAGFPGNVQFGAPSSFGTTGNTAAATLFGGNSAAPTLPTSGFTGTATAPSSFGTSQFAFGNTGGPKGSSTTPAFGGFMSQGQTTKGGGTSTVAFGTAAVNPIPNNAANFPGQPSIPQTAFGFGQPKTETLPISTGFGQGTSNNSIGFTNVFGGGAAQPPNPFGQPTSQQSPFNFTFNQQQQPPQQSGGTGFGFGGAPPTFPQQMSFGSGIGGGMEAQLQQQSGNEIFMFAPTRNANIPSDRPVKSLGKKFRNRK